MAVTWGWDVGSEAERKPECDRTDVYSLGAILFQLLTRRAPFMAGTIPATLHTALHTEAVSPRERAEAGLPNSGAVEARLTVTG
jgi:serine/threonine protein kinase